MDYTKVSDEALIEINRHWTKEAAFQRETAPRPDGMPTGGLDKDRKMIADKLAAIDAEFKRRFIIDR